MIWHRLIAENAGKLLGSINSIPDDDEVLAELAMMNSESVRYLYRSRQLKEELTVVKLKELAKKMEEAHA